MLQLNLFYEQQQIQRDKDLDPVRLTIIGGVLAISIIGMYALWLWFEAGPTRTDLEHAMIEKGKLEKEWKELGPLTDFPKIQSQATALKNRIETRTLFATQLEILRDIIPTNCQVRSFKSNRYVNKIEVQVPNKKGAPTITTKIVPAISISFEVKTMGADKVEVLQIGDRLFEIIQKDSRLKSLVEQEVVDNKKVNKVSWTKVAPDPTGNQKAVGLFTFTLDLLLKEKT
jgi:hypothetical protein